MVKQAVGQHENYRKKPRPVRFDRIWEREMVSLAHKAKDCVKDM